MLLQMEGYSIQEAASGEEALEKAKLHYYDLVLCDVRMPGMDGIETIGELKDSIHDAHFIVMTGFASEEAPIQALRLGVDDYITKPFDIPLFLEKIRGVARRRHQASRHSNTSLWALLDSLKSHYPALAEHCNPVNQRSQAWAQALGLTESEQESLKLGAWLHPLSQGAPTTESSTDEPTTGLTDEVASLLAQLGDPKASNRMVDILRAAVNLQTGRPLPDSIDPDVRALASTEETPVIGQAAENESSHQVEVTTLGRFEVRVKGKLVERKAWQSANARWVFTYLLSRGGQSVPEDRLAEVFWPGSPAKKSHRALVSSVHRARKALQDPDILVRYDKSYGVSRELDYSLDSQDLLQAYKAGTRHFYQDNKDEAVTQFEKVLELYQGPYIPDCHDPWCQKTRDELKLKTVDAAEKMAQLLLPSDPARAEEFARKAVSLESTSEPAWSTLFKALAAQGRRAEVETAFRDCTAALLEELQLKPGASLRQCYEECVN